MNIVYYPDGLIHKIIKDDSCSTEFGYFTDNSIRAIYHMQNVIIHNENGPAEIIYDRFGNVEHISFCINGKGYAHEQFVLIKLNQLLKEYDLHITFISSENYYIICSLINDGVIARSSFKNLEANVMGLIS